MPAGGVENRSEQLALVAGLLHERGTDPRLGELLAAVEHSSLLADSTGARGGERPRAPAGVRPVRAPATHAGRGRGPHHRPGAEGMGGGARRVGLRAVPAVARADRRPQARRGRVRRVDRRAVRRAAGGLRARAPERGGGPAVRGPPPRAGAARGADRRRAAPAGPGGPPPPLPARPAAPLRRERGRGGGLRLRARPAGPRRASLLHRDRRRRLPDHAPVRRPRLRRRASSPSCTRWATDCTSRASIPSTTGRRWATSPRSAWTSRRRGSGRTGSAGTGASGSTSIPGRASCFPRVSATSRWTSSTSPSTGSRHRSSGCTPTR